MEKLAEQISELEFKMYEIECLIKCIRDTLEFSICNNEDFSYLQPVAEIACQKFDSLNEEYDNFVAQIHRQFIIAE